MVNAWKVIAIIFIILFVLENILLIYGIYSLTQDENKEVLCYVEVCTDYDQYSYNTYNNVCTCYEKDLIVSQTII